MKQKQNAEREQTIEKKPYTPPAILLIRFHTENVLTSSGAAYSNQGEWDFFEENSGKKAIF